MEAVCEAGGNKISNGLKNTSSENIHKLTLLVYNNFPDYQKCVIHQTLHPTNILLVRSYNNIAIILIKVGIIYYISWNYDPILEPMLF